MQAAFKQKAGAEDPWEILVDAFENEVLHTEKLTIKPLHQCSPVSVSAFFQKDGKAFVSEVLL